MDSSPTTLERLQELGAARMDTHTPTLRELFIGVMGEAESEKASTTLQR